ncbi:MAG: hydrogenase maturation nickel metallochaperone HypA [Mailhella sp.]
MHELSLMASVMDIAGEELARHGAMRLLLLRIRCGVLDQIQPDAMRMAFEAMTAGTIHEQARLEIVEEPLRLRCCMCGNTFSPKDRNAMYAPCPLCGETVPFSVVGGEGIFLDHLEAE